MSVIDYRSGVDERADRIGLRWILWAIYLAMSWTWCIGMFLPVLLARDYGIWGWVVFAIPNVIGAAALGWTYVTSEQSRQTVAAHELAMRAFSLITAAFQVFFVFWFFRWFSPDPQDFVPATFAFALLAVAFPAGRRLILGPVVAVFVLMVCPCVFVQSCCSGQLEGVRLLTWLLHQSSPKQHLVPLGLASTFGFLLCPHLDLTLQRARQQIARVRCPTYFCHRIWDLLPRRHHLLDRLLRLNASSDGRSKLGERGISLVRFPLFPRPARLYNWCALARRRIACRAARRPAFSSLRCNSAVLGFLAYLATNFIHHWKLESGELIYRLFLSCYGLFFPAYVWLCMIPGRGRAKPQAKQWFVWAIACFIAAPMYWMGFIEGKMIWLLPGLGVVLAARIFILRQIAVVDSPSMLGAKCGRAETFPRFADNNSHEAT